jgi:hypothetical protein
MASNELRNGITFRKVADVQIRIAAHPNGAQVVGITSVRRVRGQSFLSPHIDVSVAITASGDDEMVHVADLFGVYVSK